MIPSSSPLINGTPSSSSPFSSSSGPTMSTSSTSSSVFGQPVTQSPFGNFGPHFSSSNAMTNTKVLGSPIPYLSSSSSLGFLGSSSSMTGVSQPNVRTLCGESLKASYCPTCDPQGGDPNSALVSISAMAVYCDKSHEELRLEDYQLRNGGYLPFGNQRSHPISRPKDSPSGISKPETFGFPLVHSFTEPLSSASRCDTSSFPSVLSSTTSFSGLSRCGTFGIPPVSSSALSVLCEKPSSSGTSLSKFHPSTTSASMFIGHGLTKDVDLTHSSGGFGQFHNIDQCRGTRVAPYSPTVDSSSPPMLLMSISAMFVYYSKSHDELRLEDYQQRNMVKTDLPNQQPLSSTSNPFKIPPAPFCGNFITTSATGNLSTGASSSAVFRTKQTFNPPANQFGPLQNGPGSTSNTVVGPSQGPSLGFIVQPFGLGTAYGASPITGFVNFTVPNIGSFGSSNAVFGTQQLIPMSWAPVFNFPAFFTNTPATADIPRGPSVGPGGHNEKETQATRSERVTDSDNEVNDPETVANSLADVQINGKEKADSCVPEGLRIIVEKLGFNPWDKGRIGEGVKLDLSRCILPCEEAEKDEDIIALAEFAVEQHNAMTEEGKVEMVGVIGASLEPVNGGRYHIVLEARDAINGRMPCGEPKRYYYALVLRKMNHLAVLEKWLPGKV